MARYCQQVICGPQQVPIAFSLLTRSHSHILTPTDAMSNQGVSMDRTVRMSISLSDASSSLDVVPENIFRLLRSDSSRPSRACASSSVGFSELFVYKKKASGDLSLMRSFSTI